ncbi:MAG: hypothetical protein COT85_02790 [Chlamydiae bacterium CG10_big_fil_rev_8_21_14_0_10_42_34]|nr:MAG: hypothetical protein COT85_02790 [Chlamydiae bacterium CG10_big_fil_rev_8_21_14_0_10_42_34]
MAIPIERRGMSVDDGMDPFFQIQHILSKKPLTQKVVEAAEVIFYKTKWSEPTLPQGCSYRDCSLA